VKKTKVREFEWKKSYTKHSIVQNKNRLYGCVGRGIRNSRDKVRIESREKFIPLHYSIFTKFPQLSIGSSTCQNVFISGKENEWNSNQNEPFQSLRGKFVTVLKIWELQHFIELKCEIGVSQSVSVEWTQDIGNSMGF
jgi:hypothetical protein